MRNRTKRTAVVLSVVGLIGVVAVFGFVSGPSDLQKPTDLANTLNIPRTFDESAMASVELPLARPDASPVQMTADYYYRIGIRPIYKSYPIYPADREPAGYLNWLKQQEPQIAFDPTALKTPEDWAKAGELIFDAPTGYGHIMFPAGDLYVRDPQWQREVQPPLLKDGSMPGLRYVVRKKGTVEIGVLSCGTCHSRVMPDGTLVKGAQGNFPTDRAIAWDYEHWSSLGFMKTLLARTSEKVLYGAFWLGRVDPTADVENLSYREIAAMHHAIPPGVMARHGTNPMRPARTPDLIGVKERKYLDATGLVQHRSIGDLMRYAAMNQDTDLFSQYLGHAPFDSAPFGILSQPKDPAKFVAGRYSDEALYALAMYIYSLRPPPNPNPFDDAAIAGEQVFMKEGCDNCHTPPQYTNNRLTLAAGFNAPPEHFERYDIAKFSVGTDPDSTTKTRRGTGYYKVPSLKGVWYRGPFEHNGSVMTLEDWFDARRLQNDYIPTGFKGYNVANRAVRGHEFGLNLSAEEKRQLIAFLKTL
jgi:hypothetical protein